MKWLLVAVAAAAAALVETTVGPQLDVGRGGPHLVLVLGVVWTVATGFESGLAWALTGGLALDVLAQRPFGSSAFALLLSLGAAAVLANRLSRGRAFSPVPLVFVLSYVNSLLLLIVYAALRRPIPDPDPLGTLLPGVIYDTVLAILVGPLAITLRDRQVQRSSAHW